MVSAVISYFYIFINDEIQFNDNIVMKSYLFFFLFFFLRGRFVQRHSIGLTLTLRDERILNMEFSEC